MFQQAFQEATANANAPTGSKQAAYLGKHSEEQVFQLMRDLRLGGEAQGLVLHHLEQLEDRSGVEGDAAKHKGVEAGTQRIYVCRPPPVQTYVHHVMLMLMLANMHHQHVKLADTRSSARSEVMTMLMLTNTRSSAR